MNRMGYLPLALIAIVLTSPSLVWAAKAKQVGASKAKVLSKVEIQVLFGNKLTEFLVVEERESAKISVKSNIDPSRERSVELTNLKYLMSKFETIQPKLEATERCLNQRVNVSVEGIPGQSHYHASACLSDSTDTARELMSIVNLVSYWI